MIQPTNPSIKHESFEVLYGEERLITVGRLDGRFAYALYLIVTGRDQSRPSMAPSAFALQATRKPRKSSRLSGCIV
jgi:hypothetical protein